jgi:hypothetical protein
MTEQVSREAIKAHVKAALFAARQVSKPGADNVAWLSIMEQATEDAFRKLDVLCDYYAEATS